MKLTGSEKQVLWAEEIRKEWATLLEDVKVGLDTEMVKSTRIVKDPLSGTEKKVEVEQSNITEKTKRAIRLAQSSFDPVERFSRKDLTLPNYKEELLALIKAVEDALREETSAVYWIARR